MFETELPYDHKTMTIRLEDKNFAGLMQGHQNDFKPSESQEQLVEDSLDNPYGSPKLEELCAGKRDIVIISSDHTRPVPSRVTMPILLRRIHAAAPEARVRILVATGMHRPSTHEELVNKYGEDIVANEEIVMHVATDDSMMEKIGTLPSGGECIINKVAADADLLLAEGFIEPHFFAGFSGSRKSVLPGVASYKTIMYNHNGQFVNDSHSRAGNLCHNHISEDMFAAAEMAHLAFVLNVVLNGKHEVIGSFAGDIHEAHEAGCDFVRKLAGVEPVACDIAVTTNGGYPLDQNIYQAVKGMCAAEATLPRGWRDHRRGRLRGRSRRRGPVPQHRRQRSGRVRACLHRPPEGRDPARPVDEPDLCSHPGASPGHPRHRPVRPPDDPRHAHDAGQHRGRGACAGVRDEGR